MNYVNLISNFAEFKELKSIDNTTLIGVLEDVFRHALQKQFESDENFDVIINPEKGDLEIWRNRTVVEDGAVENPNTEISVSEVKAIDPTYEVGDEYADQIDMTKFGRRAVLSLRQNLASRILDLEKAALFEKYSEKVGEIIAGEVYQVWKREVLIRDDDDNDLSLPKSEQIPNDFYRKGDTIKAIVKSVEMNNNQPRIILSRTDNQFLERLFEQEVPEIYDGLITIKKIARIPGERAKVAVESYDDRIDPVGACVGMKGQHDGRRIPQTRGGVAGYRQGRSQHPSVEDAYRLRHRRLPRGRGGGCGSYGVRRRDRELDNRCIEERRLRYGQERSGTSRRGDSLACRP